MKVLAAVSALRALDALPEPRRRYLAVLVTAATTDAERARLVLEAEHESRTARENLEASLSAEMRSRREWAQRNTERPSDAPHKAAERVTRTEETVLTARPVVSSWTTPTKVATTPRSEVRPMFAPKPKLEPVAVVEPEIMTAPSTGKPIQHGTSTAYNRDKCRCDPCKAAKAISRRKVGRVRRANGETAPCGTTTSYSRGCRCQLCRDAVAAHARKKYHEKRAREQLSPGGR